MDNLFNTITVS